ncbi:unnamed protein product [Owenia fusiformis]|uniref:Uncharacterized protein n=1 Tax=Owenia fusiformis TaxID=6347 RepID=A0A8J1UXS9_OWEFU|nr:unnamed protein product [Owenia fusiformis]
MNCKIIIFASVCVWIFTTAVCGRLLFRDTPGGDGELAGLYGGPIPEITRDRDDGKYRNLNEGGYMQTENFMGIDIKSVSYDPVSQKSLMHIGTEGVRNRLNLAQGDLCPTLDTLPELLYDDVSLSAKTDYSENDLFFEPYGSGITSPTLFNSEIYFILSGLYTDRGGRGTTKIEIRKFKGNKNLNSTETLNIFDSSELISLVAEYSDAPQARGRNIQRESTQFHYEPVKGTMEIVSGLNEDLTFYLQVFNKTVENRREQSITIDLLGVSADNTVVSLHQQDIPKSAVTPVTRFGIDHHNGTLCWSSILRIHCGVLKDGILQDKTILIDVGEGLTAGICSLTKSCQSKPDCDDDKSLTGVAIKETGKVTAVYFGCRASLAGIGGLGLVSIYPDGFRNVQRRLEKVVQPVYSNQSRTNGGDLFLADGYSDACPDDVMIRAGYRQNTSNGGPASICFSKIFVLMVTGILLLMG